MILCRANPSRGEGLKVFGTPPPNKKLIWKDSIFTECRLCQIITPSSQVCPQSDTNKQKLPGRGSNCTPNLLLGPCVWEMENTNLIKTVSKIRYCTKKCKLFKPKTRDLGIRMQEIRKAVTNVNVFKRLGACLVKRSGTGPTFISDFKNLIRTFYHMNFTHCVKMYRQCCLLAPLG